MTWKIVSDSGCDFRELKDLALDTNFENVPLTIQVGEEVFIDNAEAVTKFVNCNSQTIKLIVDETCKELCVDLEV